MPDLFFAYKIGTALRRTPLNPKDLTDPIGQ
jgi:hypothetical protein